MNSERNGQESLHDQTACSIGMDLFEANTHPFVLKIWLEETADEAGRATWRGHITHVPSGERRYLKNLDDITDFIAPYLESMGVSMAIRWRMERWLKQQKLQLRARK